MGEIADLIQEGRQCSHCGTMFEESHEQPVLCEECFRDQQRDIELGRLCKSEALPKAHYEEL